MNAIICASRVEPIARVPSVTARSRADRRHRVVAVVVVVVVAVATHHELSQLWPQRLQAFVQIHLAPVALRELHDVRLPERRRDVVELVAVERVAVAAAEAEEPIAAHGGVGGRAPRSAAERDARRARASDDRMSRVDEALGALPATRAPDAHHGARDALTPLGLAKWRAYFRAQPPLAEGIDCATEIPGVSAGYELRTGRANELEPLLRQALPIAKMNLEAPDRATLTRAFGGLGKGAPFALSEEDKGAVAPAIVALKALRAKEAKRAEGEDEASAREKKKRKRESKKEKKDKRKRTDDGGQTTSQGVSAGISTGDSDGTRNTGAATAATASGGAAPSEPMVE